MSIGLYQNILKDKNLKTLNENNLYAKVCFVNTCNLYDTGYKYSNQNIQDIKTSTAIIIHP